MSGEMFAITGDWQELSSASIISLMQSLISLPLWIQHLDAYCLTT